MPEQDTKFSELPFATAVASPDFVAVVQGGDSKRADVSLFGKPPFTLNPGDVLAQDPVPAMRIDLSDNGVFGAVLLDDNTAGIADQFFLGRNTTGTPEIGFGASLGFNLKTTTTEDTLAAEINVFWDDPTDATATAHTDIQVTPNGVFSFLGNGAMKLTLLTDPPSPAEEGMIYADTDHHLYYYNGTDWKQLDNVL